MVVVATTGGRRRAVRRRAARREMGRPDRPRRVDLRQSTSASRPGRAFRHAAAGRDREPQRHCCYQPGPHGFRHRAAHRAICWRCQRLDALVNATDSRTAEIDAVIAQHKGARGIRRLRQILPLVDGGAESPQESRTRLVLVDAGLPKPQTQIRVFNEYGDFVGRVDMGWREWRVGVEYDGAQHWIDPKQRSRDIDRQAELADCGWIIVRVSSDMLRHMQGTVVARVVAALRAAGYPPSVN